jgi:hypothetical protein
LVYKSSSRLRVSRCLSGVFFLALASLAGCDESLPPRDEPRQFIEASVRSDTSYIDVAIGNVSVDIRNDINISGAVRNLTDEVLSDDADVRLTVVLTEREDAKRTITLSGGPTNLTGIVQVRNGILTLEPRYAADYTIVWRKQRWTDGEDVFHDWRTRVIPVFDERHLHLLYFLMPPILLDVKVTAQVFKNTSPLTVSGQIVVLYRIFLHES